MTQCPRCSSPLEAATAINGLPSTDWLTCSNSACNTFVDTYKPMEHQTGVHTDNHRYIGNFGSYGTGKSKTSGKEIEKHIFLTPKANILLGANVTSQYEQTILRDFEASFPLAFMERRSVQKSYIDFINGARLMMRPFDDPDKLRSNNYSLVIILEASETKAETYHQLKTRLRNTAASITYVDEDGKPTTYDWRKMLVESNPDSGWIRTDVLLTSSEIKQYGVYAKDQYYQEPEEIDPATSSHIASTDANYYLPVDYIETNAKNKPLWWVKRYLQGSFQFAEGLIYPNALGCVVPTPPEDLQPAIIKGFKVLAAHDYGLLDTATFLFAGVDMQRGKLVIYKEVGTNETSIGNLAELYKTSAEHVELGQWYGTPLIDPKSNKRDFNKKDLVSHYAEYGVHFKPGYVRVEPRIWRLNDYIEQGRLEIWDCCKELINEFKDYKFKPKSLNDKTSDNVPIDKDNHYINPIEWICMELPADPKKLFIAAYDQWGRPIDDEEVKKKDLGGWQLGDGDDVQDDPYSEAAFGIGGMF